MFRANVVKRFCTDRSGTAAIEYALIAALVSIACLAGATAIGGNLRVAFDGVAAAFAPSEPAEPAPAPDEQCTMPTDAACKKGDNRWNEKPPRQSERIERHTDLKAALNSSEVESRGIGTMKLRRE